MIYPKEPLYKVIACMIDFYHSATNEYKEKEKAAISRIIARAFRKTQVEVSVSLEECTESRLVFLATDNSLGLESRATITLAATLRGLRGFRIEMEGVESTAWNDCFLDKVFLPAMLSKDC